MKQIFDIDFGRDFDGKWTKKFEITQGLAAGAGAAKLSKTAKVTVILHAQHPAVGRGGGS